jgi:hypothetical protein
MGRGPEGHHSNWQKFCNFAIQLLIHTFFPICWQKFCLSIKLTNLIPSYFTGPVTELLLVETNRSYVQLVSIYNSNVVSSRTLGICENPGALCVDEKGHVLIFDRATATVGLFSRAFLEKIFDLALVERAHCQLSARQGVLAILCRVTREIRIHRYGDKLRQIEEMLYEGRSEPSI